MTVLRRRRAPPEAPCYNEDATCEDVSRTKPHRQPVRIFLSCCVTMAVTQLHSLSSAASMDSSQQQQQQQQLDRTKHMILPRSLPYWERLFVVADYGGIRRSSISLLTREADDLLYARQRQQLLRQLDQDLSADEEYYEVDVDYHGKCRPRPLELQLHPNCNSFHEHIVSYLDYLGGGNYRQVWKGENDDVVWKTNRRSFAMDEYGNVQTDANVMEFFTSNPHIASLHGHCGTSLMTPLLEDTVVQTLSGGGKGVYRKEMDTTVSQNQLSDATKLQMALEFTSSLASLHESNIIHADLHSPQWMTNNNGTLQLFDFNLAFVQRYNTETQQFCAIETCTGGSFLSPEANQCVQDGSSATDVYSLGSTFYWLITGLEPFQGPDFRGERATALRVAHDSLKAVVHHCMLQASPVHRLLDDLRQRMQVDDPRQRLSAHQVLQELREYASTLSKTQ